MVERNLLGEGFIRNTLNASGTVSGTQVVSIPEMNNLIDGDFSTTAVTITGSFFISLDADLGARWKLNRIDLYTDEASSANFDMSVSTDNVEFSPLTMTGSAGLWVGSVSGTTVSGAPRYLRYEQRASADRLVQEWRAINDDTLVDFGETGTQTEVEIADAPIGKPSDSVTQLKLFNRFEQIAQGFVFIDDTGTKADDNFEISLSTGGPWLGRKTLSSRQPQVLDWIDLSEVSSHHMYKRPQSDRIASQNLPINSFVNATEQEITQNLRVVSGTAYRTSFNTGALKGWATSEFTTGSLVGGSQVGNLSTTVNPKYTFNQTFGSTAATSPDSAFSISNGFIPFRAEDYDTVEISLTSPGTIPLADIVEGPRFFWKTSHMTAFDTEHSILSTTPNQLGNGSPQTFIFDTSDITTWSGVVAGLQIQPWTTATGLGFTGEHHYTEIYKDGIDKATRLALDFDSVVSGTFTSIYGGTGSAVNEWRIVVNAENVIKEPCIITSVSIPNRLSEGTSLDHEGWFLCRFAEGFTYTDDDININVPSADPFVVKQVAVLSAHHDANEFVQERMPVYWGAEPGDMIGYGYRASTSPISQGVHFKSEGGLTTTTGGGLASQSFMDIRDASDLQTDMNAATNWFVTARKPNIQFKAISAGKYLGTGFYNTPIFDGGSNPALLALDFASTQENGATIDVDGNATNKTIKARASNTTPNTAPGLGKRKRQFMMGAHPSGDPSRFDSQYTSNYVIGLMNAEVETRQTATSTTGDTQIANMGAGLLYHEVNQEMWILNINISGTVNTDMRPTWDVYGVDEGSPPNYLRTQHMTGNIPYTYTNNSQTTDNVFIFEPSGWQADYTREEIYIISREDCFSVGNGTYNGLILTLDGVYKDVFFRNDQLLQDIIDAGVETSTTNADRHLTNMRTSVYRSPYFYSLTTPSASDDSDGTHIDVYRLGNNPVDLEDVNDVEFITEIDLGTVAGLTTVTAASPVDTLTYCSSNDLFYFIKDDGDDIFTFRAAVTGDPPSESIVITAGPIEEATNSLFATASLVEAFSAFFSDIPSTPWEGSGNVQRRKRMVDLTYDKDRDSFWHLLNYRSNHTEDFVQEGQFTLNDYFWNNHNHSVLMEYGADTQGITVSLPRYPHPEDSAWGTLSGTLAFEQVAEDSVLFPTGRYAQVKYQLNADTGRNFTPYLEESRINQGLRVSDIPVSGTQNIYLRTNIADTETIGDQEGRLKVFWELKAS